MKVCINSCIVEVVNVKVVLMVVIGWVIVSDGWCVFDLEYFVIVECVSVSLVIDVVCLGLNIWVVINWWSSSCYVVWIYNFKCFIVSF